MASIFSLDKQVASLPKHGFPMSQTFDFTSSCGHIIPVYFDQLNPGEKFRYKVDLFTRTQPLTSPANVDIDEYIDVFFVPLQKISAAAENILFQISDKTSSSLPDTATQIVLPLLDLDKLKVDIIGGGSNTYLGTWNQSDPVLGGYATFFESRVSGIMRLFDAAGVDPTVLYDGATCYRPKINPAFFATYQSIYYDYFRLSNWENNRITAYNLDAAVASTELLATGMPWATPFVICDLLQLRYRAWNKDYFTTVFPNPLISPTGMMATGIQNLNVVNQWLVNAGFAPIVPSGSIDYTGSQTTESLQTSSSFSSATDMIRNSTAALRSLFAVDKLLKVTARAGKHYDDQVLAHFGFNVPKGYSHEVVHLGVHHQRIHIGEVISTASTGTGEIGELAGKGYGKEINQIVDNFVAPCHGYVMAVYSCAPRVLYIGGIDRIHTMVNRYDWFLPAIDNLGMQPLFEFEYTATGATPTNRIGWQLRYFQMKNKKDRATYAFMTKANASSGLVYNDAPFAEWNISDPFPNAGGGMISLGRLLVSPDMLSAVTLWNYVPTPTAVSMYDSGDPAPQNLYSSDPLIHHVVQTVSKISGMSIYGLDDKAI